MPSVSQQQQKLFGLALAFKRGEVPSSEVSDEIKAIADRMSEKDIEDFAATKHKGLPKMKEQLRKIVREIMREKVISEMELSKDEMDKLHSDGEVEVDGEKVTYDESVNEAAGKEAMGIAAFTGTRGDAVQKFIDDNKLDAKKLFNYVKGGKLTDRLNFVTAIVGTPGNSVQKKMIKMFGESVNEGASNEEKKIVMMAIKKIAKYRNVPLDVAVVDVIRAANELERTIKK